MHASRILRRCLADVLEPMHKARARRLLAAVEALVAGRRLTLTDLARSWPGAVWVHAPLKALDRLLSNPHLRSVILPLSRAIAAWLLAGITRPLVLVDWADLKEDGRWAILRASVPVGGRALTLYEEIFPLKRMGQPRAQAAFLRNLWDVLPRTVIPIIVTDAGFRSDWFRAVRALGWDFIGRVRNNTHVCLEHEQEWNACSSLHRMARESAADLGPCCIVKGDPMSCRLVLVRRKRKGRQQRTRSGKPQQSGTARKARKAAREPWLLATSLDAPQRSAHQIVASYAKRMQIEEAFRDLKSHRYGVGFEDSLSRKSDRLRVLLMLHTLASFASWLTGIAAERARSPDPMTRQARHATRYSLLRRGMEWLRQIRLPPDLVAELRPLCARSPLAHAQ